MHLFAPGDVARLFGELVGAEQRALDRTGQELVPAGGRGRLDEGQKARNRYCRIVMERIVLWRCFERP